MNIYVFPIWCLNSCLIFVVLVNAILISFIENILLFFNDKTMNNTYKDVYKKDWFFIWCVFAYRLDTWPFPYRPGYHTNTHISAIWVEG